MNKVWLSGKIIDAPSLPNGERILVIQTSEGRSKTILTKTHLKTPVDCGAFIEAVGFISDGEPVTVAGVQVTGPNGRAALRNVVYLTEISIQAHTEKKETPVNAKPTLVAASQSQFIQSAEMEVKNAYVGPELPWS